VIIFLHFFICSNGVHVFFHICKKNENIESFISYFKMTTDWLLRVGDGMNLKRSTRYKIWGIRSGTSCAKYFLTHVRPGDRLWFIQNKSCGKVLAVATYLHHNVRELGPFINVSMSDEELGWTTDRKGWDIELHYTNVYDLDECELFIHIKGPLTIRKYDALQHNVSLPSEYDFVRRYSKATYYV